MTDFAHEVHHCEKCGNGYCMGCFGEKCPHCELMEYIQVLEDRVDDLQFCLDACAEYTAENPPKPEYKNRMCDYKWEDLL